MAKEKKVQKGLFCVVRDGAPFIAASRWVRPLLAFLAFRESAAWAAAVCGKLRWGLRGWEADPAFFGGARISSHVAGAQATNWLLWDGLWRIIWTRSACILTASLRFRTFTVLQCRRKRMFRLGCIRFWGG